MRVSFKMYGNSCYLYPIPISEWSGFCISLNLDRAASV